MKTRIVVAIALIAASSTLFAAPQGRWSAEQQDLIDHLVACWNSSYEARAKDDPQIWFDKIAFADGAAWWFTQDGAPRVDLVGRTQRDWEAGRARSGNLVEIQPLVVNIYGDVGIIHFYAQARVKTPTGTEVVEQKRTEVFKKMDGKWRFIGGQVTNVPR
jgi:hypothetical protein